MDSSFLILLSSLFLIGISVYLFVSVILKQNNESNAMAWAEGSEPDKSKHPLIQFSRPLVHNFTLSHVRRIKSKKYRAKVENKLILGGLTKELNVDEFIGLQILWGIAFPILFTILNFGLQLNFPYFVILIISLVGIYFPHAYCNSSYKKRKSDVLKDLPLFVDLLALSTEAGLDFFGSIKKITEKAPKGNTLAEEFLEVLKSVQLGQTKKDALLDLDKRLDTAELKSVISIIIDSGETGASISESLKAKSVQMRFERFARAEELGGKAAQKILIPMMLFILPAIFIIVFAPAVFQFVGK